MKKSCNFNVTVKCSFDGGLTYPKKLQISKKCGGYCDLAHDSRGRIYVLWETAGGVMDTLTRFSFADVFGESDLV